MSERSYLEQRAAELSELLEAADDPVLRLQLDVRLKDLEEKLSSHPEVAKAPPHWVKSEAGESLVPTWNIPRTALFLKGGGVVGRVGVQPKLAGEALIEYEKMFVEQAKHNERQATGRRRRMRGGPSPTLLFTGTPRGSFGLEFTPKTEEDGSLPEAHAAALEDVANALAAVGQDGDAADFPFSNIAPAARMPMKRFLRTLANYDAELRLSFVGRPSQSISREKVKAAAERLDRVPTEETIEEFGVFRGLRRESKDFDLKLEKGGWISGSISEDLVEEDFDRINGLSNLRCLALLNRRTVRQPDGSQYVNYVLLDAEPDEVADSSSGADGVS